MIRIWLETAHLGALRIGGWTYLVQDAGGLRGMAGGARTIDAERHTLTAFNAALSDLTDGAAVELTSASPALLAIPGLIAKAEAGEDAPSENLDLWAKATTHLRRLTLTVRRAQATPGTPTAFTVAWAERACDLARAKGTFANAIPKPNLARAGL